MKIEDALSNVRRLFLDTAPAIYFLERNPAYYERMETFFIDCSLCVRSRGASEVRLKRNIAAYGRSELDNRPISISDFASWRLCGKRILKQEKRE
ncbi:MAG: hypothetical protein NUW37_13660, partial [Planctomycetes bacterium]|nr:hypothetical protein [Planctomycetota bacterium]